MNFKSV